MKQKCDVNSDPVSRGATEARPFPDPLALDWDYLTRRTSGDAELEGELLRAFRDQAHSVLRRLRGGDPTTSRERADLAHFLKGSARAIGATRVGSACEIYEARLGDCHRAGSSDRIAAGEDALRGLEAAVAEAMDEIDRPLAAGGS